MRQALELALEALQFALHIGFPESSESQIKKGEKAYQQHRAAITAIKEALAQPEQEPVACKHSRYSVDVHEQTGTCYDCGAEGRMRFVVDDTHPQAREPLTDEQLETVFPAIATYHEANKTLYRSIARAIEAAHGIKGEA